MVRLQGHGELTEGIGMLLKRRQAERGALLLHKMLHLLHGRTPLRLLGVGVVGVEQLVLDGPHGVLRHLVVVEVVGGEVRKQAGVVPTERPTDGRRDSIVAL